MAMNALYFKKIMKRLKMMRARTKRKDHLAKVFFLVMKAKKPKKDSKIYPLKKNNKKIEKMVYLQTQSFIYM